MPLPDGIELRRYESRDADAVRRLHALAVRRLAASHHTPAQLAAHEALIMADAYADDLARSNLLLAEARGGRLVATGGWLPHPDRPATARIRKVFVHPDLAGRGLGSAMVRAAEAAAHAAGLPNLFVRANINAVRLYEKLGYRALEPGVMPAGLENLPVMFMERLAGL